MMFTWITWWKSARLIHCKVILSPFLINRYFYKEALWNFINTLFFPTRSVHLLTHSQCVYNVGYNPFLSLFILMHGVLLFEHFLSLTAQRGAPGSDTFLAHTGHNCWRDGEKDRGTTDEVLNSSRQLISILLISLSNGWDLKEDKCNCFPSANMSGSVREFKTLLHILYQGDLCSQLPETLSVPCLVTYVTPFVLQWLVTHLWNSSNVNLF